MAVEGWGGNITTFEGWDITGDGGSALVEGQRSLADA